MVSTMIRVTCGGCGIKYTDGHGVARHALKTPEDGPFLCEIEQAKRLVGLGVAVYVGDPVQEPEKPTQQGNEDKKEQKKLVGHLDADELATWDYNDLKKLAADMGVVPEGKKKDDYIKAIVAAEVEVDPENDEDEDNELPDLDAANPV